MLSHAEGAQKAPCHCPRLLPRTITFRRIGSVLLRLSVHDHANNACHGEMLFVLCLLRNTIRNKSYLVFAQPCQKVVYASVVTALHAMTCLTMLFAMPNRERYSSLMKNCLPGLFLSLVRRLSSSTRPPRHHHVPHTISCLRARLLLLLFMLSFLSPSQRRKWHAKQQKEHEIEIMREPYIRSLMECYRHAMRMKCPNPPRESCHRSICFTC